MTHDHQHRGGPAHAHTHPPRHAERAQHRAFGGPVVIDVGDGAGALIVRLDHEWIDDELHLVPGGPGGDTHTGVWPRRLGDRDVPTAVFGSLPAGVHTIADHDSETPLATVTVPEGEVVEIDLRRT